MFRVCKYVLLNTLLSVLRAASLSLGSDFLLAEALVLLLVDVLNQDTLVLEDVTLRLDIALMVAEFKSKIWEIRITNNTDGIKVVMVIQKRK